MKIIDIISIFIAVILLLLVSACGNNEHDEQIDIEENYIKILTINTLESYVSTINHAVKLINESRIYPYTLEIDFQVDDVLLFQQTAEAIDAEKERRETQLRAEFMAGIAPDLIINDSFTLHNFASSGFLTDFYTLIENEDDFFMNVLEAFEFRGGLYSFPMNFELTYLGINENLPQHFIDKFTAFSYIRISDLMNMYLNLLDNYKFMYIGTAGIRPFLINIGHHTQSVNFNHIELIKYLELSNMFLQRVSYSPMDLWRGSIPPVDYIKNLALTNMFYSPMNLITGRETAEAFFHRDIPFTHFIPVSDDYGNLIINLYARPPGFGGSFGVWLPNGENIDLAWQFVKYLIQAFSEVDESVNVGGGFFTVSWGNSSFAIPTKRSLFENHMQTLFTNIRRTTEFGTREVFDPQIETALARIYEYVNMPMTLKEPILPINLIMTPFNDFSLGLITAQEALNRAENAVNLWLME